MVIWLVYLFFSVSLLYIFLFSLAQLHLVIQYFRSKRKAIPQQYFPKPSEWPSVCIQLPVYNEKYVVERLIRKINQIDYPHEKLEVQVLDDSDDETTDILNSTIRDLSAENKFKVLRRKERSGFKAGALSVGLSETQAEFIAIFDADFLPEADFLKRTIPIFDKNVGAVQTRWGHINKEYNILTQLQAFGLDAHFTIEQVGRSFSGSFINFNGTGGIWKRDCILDAGGWSADTITEDIDLSYRAQLKGWKIKYLEEYVSPAELPLVMSAIKSQQFRWNKGGAETARKHLGKVLRSDISVSAKIHSFFHLLNSSVFLTLFIASVLSLPVMVFKSKSPFFEWIFSLGIIFVFGILAIALFYAVAQRATEGKGWLLSYLKYFPPFFIISMGLSIHNGIAVFEGLTNRKSAFVRTPKFNALTKEDKWQGNKYLNLKFTPLVWLEGLASIYFIIGIILGLKTGEMSMLPFHIMLATGFGIVFIYSIRSLVYARN